MEMMTRAWRPASAMLLPLWGPMTEGLMRISHCSTEIKFDDLRPTDTQISSTHAVDLRGLLYTVQVKHERSQGRIVGVRQSVDECVHRIPTHSLIVNSCSIDEFGVELLCQQRVR